METIDDEAKLSDTDPTAVETIRKSDGFDEKPDINDVPMEESQVSGYFVPCNLFLLFLVWVPRGNIFHNKAKCHSYRLTCLESLNDQWNDFFFFQ